MNETEYGLILNSISDGVCVISRNGKITCFNKAAEKITGHKSENVISQPAENIFNPKHCQCAECLHKVMEEGETLLGVATCIQGREGQRIPIRVNVSPLHRKDRITGAVMTFQDMTEVETLRKQISGSYCHQDIITKNPRMLQLMQLLPGIASTGSTVLVLGESGTGKELLARAIHQLSAKANEPFIAVNCGAIPDNLLESELFGYKKGAFTDASKDKKGRFALAGRGTLFLDEIGDISPSMQVKLLRVLQEKKYEPLGSEKSYTSHCRIITATNRNLKELMSRNQFRQDLYYRINVIQLQLPPLRQRTEDIVLLTRHFMDKINAEYGKKLESISRDAMKALMSYHFPGNIRELENIIERAYALTSGNEVGVNCLPEEILSTEVSSQSGQSLCTLNNSFQPPVIPVSTTMKGVRLTDEEEKELLEKTLYQFRGHRAQTANALGITTVTLWRKMKKHNIIN